MQELANVYQAVQAADQAEQDVILLGDFNRNPDDQSAYGPLLSIRLMEHLFQLPQKSHIRDTSLYDNIFFQTHHVIEYTGESGIDRFDEIHFGNDDACGITHSKRSSSRVGHLSHRHRRRWFTPLMLPID